MKKVTLVLAALAGIVATGAQAQTYPTRPITMIVPFAAGGPTDVIARIVGDHMSRTLGQQIVIENVAGAGGTTGITRAAQSQPAGCPERWAQGDSAKSQACPGLAKIPQWCQRPIPLGPIAQRPHGHRLPGVL